MNIKEIHIRQTNSNDLEDIIKVENLAFGSIEESDLVKNILNDPTSYPVLSLLAFYKNEAVGHILFSKATIENNSDQSKIHILAPLAVIPKYQKMGIGGLLTKTGIEMLREKGTEIVFVLGHMDYYPRYGFTPDAKSLGFPAPYPIPEQFANAWMLMPLTPSGVKIAKGKVKCSEALDKPEYWRE